MGFGLSHGWWRVVRVALAVFALASLVTPSARVAAQMCEDDAGAICEDDAGLDGDDSGVPLGTTDAGQETAACSCRTSDNESGQGLIHVCTGSNESDVCATLDCDLGTFWGSACPSRSARLCCDMPDRGLYSQLYEDCEHPNCEAGFLAQCRDFGGEVYEGACKNPGGSFDVGKHDDSDDGFCSVVRVHGTRDTSEPILHGAWLGACALLLTLARRSRKRASR